MISLDVRKAKLDRIINLFDKLATKLTQEFLRGEISVADWQIAMKSFIKRENASALFAGIGAETPGDVPSSEWLKLGNIIKNQFSFLENFARQLFSGIVYSEAEIFRRVDLYIKSAITSFWKAVEPGIELPGYPGENVQCGSNCKCEWVLEDVFDPYGKKVAVLATWKLNPAEHCVDCLENAGKWNPVRISV